MEVLTPYGFVTEQRLLAYLGRERGANPADREAAIEAANAAIGWMEAYTHRRLAARTYRTAATVAMTVSSGSTAATGTGFTTSVKALDDVLGTGIAIGTRVASVTSASALVLTRAATDNVTTTTVGSVTLRRDGSGTAELFCPEYPLAALYGANYLDDDGVETALDIDGARMEGDTGRLFLPQDTFPEGSLNITLECLAGYQEPSATSRGDWNDWGTLARVQLRAAAVFFEDEHKHRGRSTNAQALNVQDSLTGFEMPRDIVEALAPYMRLL